MALCGYKSASSKGSQEPLEDWSASYQLVGRVTAYQGNDG